MIRLGPLTSGRLLNIGLSALLNVPRLCRPEVGGPKHSTVFLKIRFLNLLSFIL
jgi:hypothetical protein